MRLSLLLAREPFGEILEKTLSGFWSDSGSAPVVVRWGTPAAGDQVWRGNVYLNFFCVEGVDPACFEVIVQEFGHSRSAWRRGIQAAYVQAAIRPPTRRWLTQVGFGVSQPVPYAQELLIIGGNRRIRIIHPRAGRSVVIHKSGFTRTAFDREVHARVGAGSPLAPAFKGVHRSGNAFEEEYFVGTPANRLSADEERRVREEALVRLVTEVHRPTLRAASLSVRLREIAEQVEGVTGGSEAGWKRAIENLAVRVGGASLGLSFSHGDFQDANILVAGSRVRVIDWETAAERSQFYDVATLRSGIRLAQDRVRAWRQVSDAWIRSGSGFPEILIRAETRQVRTAFAALWWLEETLLRAEEAQMCAVTRSLPSQGRFDVELAALEAFLSAHH